MERITRIAPSARLEEQISELLSGGLSEDGEHLAALGRLGARLVLQRAVEEEVAAFLDRARYERTPTATGSRNGTRPKPIQTAEGEISIAMPQVRNTAERFVSRVIPDTKAVVRTRPLEALVIGSYVRGLSDRDIESLAQEAGLGQISKSTVSPSHLPRAARPLHGVLQHEPARRQLARAVLRRGVSGHATEWRQGGGAGRLGLHDRRQAGAGGRPSRAARVS